MTELHEHALKVFNYVRDSARCVRGEVKLIGLSPRGYAADQLNLFDGALVVVSVVDLSLELLSRGQGAAHLRNPRHVDGIEGRRESV